MHVQVSIDFPVTAPTSPTACVQFCDKGSATQMQGGVLATIAGVRPKPVCWVPPSRLVPVDVEEASGGTKTSSAASGHVCIQPCLSEVAGATAQRRMQIMGTSMPTCNHLILA